MDHSFIEQNNHIDRYVRGTMPVEERAAFEEHFLDCPECLEQLEYARSLRESVRIAGAGLLGSAQTRVTRPFSGWRWLAAAAAACTIALTVATISLYRQLDHARSEVDRTQLAYASERERSASVVESAAQNAPIVYALDQTRGGGKPKTIELPAAPRWLVFSIAIDATQFQSYRARIRTSGGKEVWQKDNIQPSSADSIAIPVLSTALAPGVYELTVEGRDPAKGYVPVPVVSFEVSQSAH